MPQAEVRLPSSHPSVEQVAGQINTMIAERAAERPKAPEAEAQPTKPREPGIYFGLPSAEYHANQSLGSSDLKRLLQAPAVYWFHSHLNPDRQPTPDSPAKQKGRALHKLVLEGLEAFERAYSCETKPDAYPNALVTLEDLKVRCRAISEPVSGSKSELS